MTLDKLYPMPCPFQIGDIIYNHRFDQSGYIIRVYGEWFDYQLNGTKGIIGVRYSTARDCILTGRLKDEQMIRELEENAKIFFRRIRPND
jgi:hypothetical protein